MNLALDEMIEMDDYAIDRPTSAEYCTVVEAVRADLRADGCAVIKDFINPQAVSIIGDEINARKQTTHFSTESINPYFHTTSNDAYPNQHPVNTFIERTSGFIPGDSWEPTTANRRLFEHPMLARFLADCLELDVLYPYADPLAGLTANILNPGQQFTWHFDTNEFAVTVLIDAADEGGLFEYVPNIRSAQDESFDAIQAILDGERMRIRTLDLCPGDLQIFRGRYSLHRVTRVGKSSKPRHASIYAYTEQPGVVGRVARTQQLFGRVLPEHIQAEEERVRNDTLLD